MAQMIPNFIDQEDPRLCGERRVFMWLSDDAVPGFVLHSLLQKNHRNKMIGEVDFLYISSKGILCIEVKGGKEIYRKSGEWYSVNKLNVHNKIKDPFRQAKDCMYALKNYLIETYGYMSQEAKCLLGYAVIFPECKFTGHGNDLVTEVMFDCKWNLDQFPHFLNNVFDFWKRQTKEKQQYDPPMLTNEQVNKYINLLRGDFKVVPSMNLELQYIDKQIIELTEEQFDALDFTLENKRVVIQGGAGTGKSLLAIEKVRKTIAKNKSVLYICFNKNMAKYAQHALEDCIPNNCFVGTYHSLIQKTLKQTDLHELNIKEISNMFLSNKPETFQYDCLIVDEAQDLMNICVLEVINNFLKDGMEKGEWVLFLDPNQNIFNHTDEYDFAWEYIKSVYTPTIVPLSKNCRNTEQIGRKTSSLTLVPPAKHMKISGPKVITKAYDTDTDLINLLKKELTSLLAGGASPSDIVILSKYRHVNSGIRLKENICGLNIYEPDDITKFNRRELNYFTVQSYKGLESKIVFYIDVDGFLSPQDRMINYVAMSRAKILLYVFYKNSKKNEYLNMIENSQELFIKLKD